MRANRLLLLATSLSVLGSAAQTGSRASAQHEKAVEENLKYATVIKGRPEAKLSLQDQMAKLHVPGVSIAVIHDMRIEWARGYGVARLGGPSVSTETLFSAASMSKPITAMAVLRLAQEGKIDLDTDVNVYLKSWKLPVNQYNKNHSVTVRELLGHTSGIGTHSSAIYDPDKGIPSILQILNGQRPATTPPVQVEAEPGKKYAYANGGYLILQLLITDVTGKTFARSMDELVLGPLGMKQSGFFAPLPLDKSAKAATGYAEDGTTGSAPAHFVEPNAAAGGLWTTATDYAKFTIELQQEYVGQSHLILNQKIAKMMVTQGMGPSENYRSGLGLRVGGKAPNVYFEQGGSAVFQDDMVGYVSGNGVVVLTNGGGGGRLVDEIVRGVAQVYNWPDFQPVQHTVVNLAPTQLARLTGRFDFVKVTRNGDHLMAEIPLGSIKQELLAESSTEFFLRDEPTRIMFDVNPQGKATGIEFVTSMVHWHRDKNP